MLVGLALAASCACAASAGPSKSGADRSSRNELLSSAAAPASATTEAIEPANGATPDAASGADATPAPGPRPSKFNPLSAVSLDSLRATRERPLFSLSRRPPAPRIVAAAPEPPPPPPPAPAEPEQPSITLVGVIHGADSDMGLFFDQSGKPLRLRIGEANEGWTVRSVTPRAAVLEKEARQVTVALPARDAELASSPASALAALASAGAERITPLSHDARQAAARRAGHQAVQETFE